jgi:hypothetical protein
VSNFNKLAGTCQWSAVCYNRADTDGQLANGVAVAEGAGLSRSNTRHVTLSTERGMVTELEMSNPGFAAGGQYLLRYHKSDKPGEVILDISTNDAASWVGFRYRNTQWSFIKFAAKPGTIVGLA